MAVIEPIAPFPPERVARAAMIQRWMTSAFLHWRIEPSILRPLVPEHLEIDRFDGSAWVGLVPFEMLMRLPYQPPIPVLSRYPETNVRTYVHDERERRSADRRALQKQIEGLGNAGEFAGGSGGLIGALGRADFDVPQGDDGGAPERPRRFRRAPART
jgi:hypothetical protein